MVQAKERSFPNPQIDPKLASEEVSSVFTGTAACNNCQQGLGKWQDCVAINKEVLEEQRMMEQAACANCIETENRGYCSFHPKWTPAKAEARRKRENERQRRRRKRQLKDVEETDQLEKTEEKTEEKEEDPRPRYGGKGLAGLRPSVGGKGLAGAWTQDALEQILRSGNPMYDYWRLAAAVAEGGEKWHQRQMDGGGGGDSEHSDDAGNMEM